MSTPACAAAPDRGMAAAVRKAVGRDVEDAHHLRLVEPQHPLAELERRARRRDRAAIAWRARLRGDRRRRKGPLRTRRRPSDLRSAHRPRTSQPARQPRDLAVAPDRRVDELDRAGRGGKITGPSYHLVTPAKAAQGFSAVPLAAHGPAFAGMG
jgi:hypothetical protein